MGSRLPAGIVLPAGATGLHTHRDKALDAITAELKAIRERLERTGLTIDTVGNTDTGDRTLLVSSGASLVKVEVNIVFRGTVLPVQKRP